MRNDHSFEQELEAVLQDLASDGAPEALVSRVATISMLVRPARKPLPGFGSRFLALAAAAAIAVVVAVVALPSLSPRDPIGGGSGTPSPTAVPSPSASSPAPSPTPAPTGSASPAATASPSGPAEGAVPDGFQPVSVTFASANEGWVLGEAPCSDSPCAWVLHTTDAGRTWAAIGAPRTAVASSRSDTESSGVTTLRFADPRNGWAFGKELWRTHDGGASWAQVTLPGLHEDPTIFALEADDGLVHAAVLDCGPAGCALVIETSAVEGDDWALAPVKLPVGGGPVPTAQLVLHGSGGWVIQVDRVVVNGARLIDGQWREWQPPCADVQGSALLAASSGTELVAACNVGEWADPQGQHLFVSHDGGRTFSEADTPLPLATISGIAAASESVIALAGSTDVRSEIEASFDSGQTWTPAFEHTPGATFLDLGFTTRTQGVAIVSDPEGGNLLLMTRDGGRSWRSVSF